MSEGKVDWQVEQEKFMMVAYERTVAAAHAAFRSWHWRKREDAVQEALAKMVDQWWRLVERGKNPEPMMSGLIKFAILWVRYDRKVAGRARSFDVFDYRAGMTRHLLDSQGHASPTDRSDPNKEWVDWNVSDGDDPAELVAAFEEVEGMTLEQYLTEAA